VQIIPAIDIIGGKCIRLAEGNFEARKEYGTDAVEMAKCFLLDGARFLHIVDIEGAKEGRIVNWQAIEGLGKLEGLRVQVGGGVRSDSDVEKLLSMGVQRVVIGSLAIRSPEKLKGWAERFSPDKFCIAIDLKNGEIAYSGWQRSAPISLKIIIPNLIESGFSSFLSTDIKRDGMMNGPNIEMYNNLVNEFPQVKWLASGGVTSVADLRSLKQTGVAGAIIGKAFYEGILSYKECVKAIC
jgi:phosphoribosylformimino-5-aminoimidazole carboxamide ribotide isomerase